MSTGRKLGNARRAPRSGLRGSALIELALVAPLLLIFVAGVLNYGFALRTAAAAATAARAGAQYGSSGPTQANDTAGIRTAALNAAPKLTGMTVNSAVSCQCPGGGAVNCGGTCVNGNMSVYVQVTVKATAATFFRYTGLPFTGAVQAQARMRAQ
jgi:Flp pilus assembly protein TadG